MDTTELRRLGTKRGKLLRDLDEVNEQIRDLVVEALRADLPVIEVQRMSGYSLAQVRNIARVAGVPPRRGRAA